MSLENISQYCINNYERSIHGLSYADCGINSPPDLTTELTQITSSKIFIILAIFLCCTWGFIYAHKKEWF
jgi:hypothetical protein